MTGLPRWGDIPVAVRLVQGDDRSGGAVGDRRPITPWIKGVARNDQRPTSIATASGRLSLLEQLRQPLKRRRTQHLQFHLVARPVLVHDLEGMVLFRWDQRVERGMRDRLVAARQPVSWIVAVPYEALGRDFVWGSMGYFAGWDVTVRISGGFYSRHLARESIGRSSLGSSPLLPTCIDAPQTVALAPDNAHRSAT